MSDFEEGMTVGIILGRKKFSGGSTTRNSIFHDILDNSDVVATIPIYGDYKLTLNFWESDRQDIYNAGLSSDRCIAMQSGNEGYCQNYY